MKTITKTIECYQFGELTWEAQQKAMSSMCFQNTLSDFKYDVYRDYLETAKKFCEAFHCNPEFDQDNRSGRFFYTVGWKPYDYLGSEYYNEVSGDELIERIQIATSKRTESNSWCFTNGYADEVVINILDEIYDWYTKELLIDMKGYQLVNLILEKLCEYLTETCWEIETEGYAEDFFDGNEYWFDSKGNVVEE